MSWTDERVELLKKLWTDGLSASQIAAQLGGVTRNAVIGKVHRLKLSGRAKSPSSGAPKMKRPSAPRPSAPRNGGYSGGGRGGTTTVTHAVGATMVKSEVGLQTLAKADHRPIEDIIVPISKHVALVDLNENTCKWPQGDPLTDEFHFCGHQSEESSPYCKYHARLAFQPSSERKRSR
ncbi:GcrA family cell cycle regulator [Oricola cellulosilytica]|uniref:GcrA cell cycle regulator n=1 Tax=Oricola cellulosilytica TaxID=1429082 RepID=A0A4R0PJB5_9HYPH|nr:GcrA family cell cycle regulator [Oricola cellulosilytica]TCD16500.1 GcrA cell cycle regulator [Oricola cellulosilytica]